MILLLVNVKKLFDLKLDNKRHQSQALVQHVADAKNILSIIQDRLPNWQSYAMRLLSSRIRCEARRWPEGPPYRDRRIHLEFR